MRYIKHISLKSSCIRWPCDKIVVTLSVGSEVLECKCCNVRHTEVCKKETLECACRVGLGLVAVAQELL